MFGFEDALFRHGADMMVQMRPPRPSNPNWEPGSAGVSTRIPPEGLSGFGYFVDAVPELPMIELQQLPDWSRSSPGQQSECRRSNSFGAIAAFYDLFASYTVDAFKLHSRGDATRPIARRNLAIDDLAFGKGRTVRTVSLSAAEPPQSHAGPQSAWKSLIDKLGRFGSLRKGWDSYSAPPPSKRAIENVRGFIERLQKQSSLPSKLAPSVVGGIGVTFKRGSLKAYVEFSNKGSVHSLFSDGVADPTVEKVQPNDRTYDELIARIATYLHE
jgi:hypothetical protein